MNKTVEDALALWPIQVTQWHLIAARENQVFKVDTVDHSYALRIHRKGYRTDAELRSELQWIHAVARGGLHVPTPVPSLSGQLLHHVDDFQIDVLSWLSGEPIGRTGEPLVAPDKEQLFYNIGHEMARLHNVSDDWTLPEDFTRCHWDREGLLGENPLWDRFWENPTLSSKDQALFLQVRDAARTQLTALEGTLDYGLIHADLVRENLMADGEKIQLIDFDDSGFGFRQFDVATALFKNKQEPDYNNLQAALISGYRSQRPLNTETLDLFMLLRALTYVGWIISRQHEEGSEQRNTRFVSNARKLAEQFR